MSVPRMRRIAPFDPTQVAGCQMWLDGSDTSSLTFSSGSNISTWRDKSGNGNNATQSTSGNQPTYSGGTVYAGNQWFVTPITSYPTAESFFIVFSTSTGVADIISGTTGSSREVLLYTGNKVYLGSHGTDPSSTTPNSGPIPLNTALIYDIQYTSTVVTFNVNGSVTASGTPAFTFSGSGTSQIGSSGYSPNNMYGTIYEIIYYNVAVGAQKQQIQGYLAQKWGLKTVLPPGHPGIVTTIYPLTRSMFLTPMKYATSTFTPTGISGCALWLDANDINGNGTTPSNGATVSTWIDKSGSGINLTAVGTPTYVSASSAVYLSGGAYMQNTNFNFTTYTIIIVIQTSGNAPVYTNTTSTPYSGFFPNYGGNIYLVSADNNWIGGTGLTTGITYLFTIQYDNLNNINLWSNGNTSPDSSGTTAGTITRNMFILGKRNSGGYTESMTGNVYEIVQYNTTLTLTQRQQVEGYLAWKWGLQANLPANHPYKSVSPNITNPLGITRQALPSTLFPTPKTNVGPGVVASPLYYQVDQSFWNSYWQPYLTSLVAANSAATASIGTSISASVSGGFASTLASNRNLYIYSWTNNGITVVNTTTGSLVTTITGTGIQGYSHFSSCLGPDGNIYYPPYNATTVGVLYPATNTFSASAITMVTTPASGAYCGAVLAPNGKIYCIPRAYQNSSSIGIIDPVAQTFNIMPSAVVTGNQGYIGGVLAPNGKIYCIPFVDGGSVSVGIIDPVANTFTTMPNSSVSTGGAYGQGVLAPNGKIYCIPYNATNVAIIDPVANTFDTTTITNAQGGSYYTGGCLGANGKIYFAPRSGTEFGVVDPVLNTLTTSGGVSGTSGSGYTGAFLTPSGSLYCPNVNGATVNVVNFTGITKTPTLNYCLSAYTNKS